MWNALLGEDHERLKRKVQEIVDQQLDCIRNQSATASLSTLYSSLEFLVSLAQDDLTKSGLSRLITERTKAKLSSAFVIPKQTNIEESEPEQQIETLLHIFIKEHLSFWRKEEKPIFTAHMACWDQLRYCFLIPSRRSTLINMVLKQYGLEKKPELDTNTKQPYGQNEKTNLFLALVDSFLLSESLVKEELKKYSGRAYQWSRERRIPIKPTIITNSRNPLHKIPTFEALYQRHEVPPAFLLKIYEEETYRRDNDPGDMAILKENRLTREIEEKRTPFSPEKTYEYYCYSAYKGATIIMPHMPLVGHPAKFSIEEIFLWQYGLDRHGWEKQPTFWASVIDQDFFETESGIHYAGVSKCEGIDDNVVDGFIQILQELRNQVEITS